MADDANKSFADRIAREGEDVVARLVQELSEQPFVRTLLERAFDARERAAQGQELALAALNIPSASDIERLTRRIRSVALRMEGLEDGVDRLDGRFAAIEKQLTQIAADVAALAGERRDGAPKATLAPKPRRAATKTAATRTTPAATSPRARRQPPGRDARQP